MTKERKSRCELVWQSDRLCKDEATRRIKLTIHSNFYAGLYELNNTYKCFNVCERHFGLIKNEKDVQLIN